MIVDLMQDSGETVKVLGNPVKISNHDESFIRAPKLGEHTDEIIKRWLNRLESDQD